MSANIDTMLYVKETPWHAQGHKYDTPPMTSEEIIKGASLDWTVAAAPMMSDLEDGRGMQKVQGYHAIYREDTHNILGVINKPDYAIKCIQNTDMFRSIEGLLGKYIETDTAASLGLGETVFGCFKIHEQYKVLDDDIDHYFVVMNDHSRSDGKVTVLNTPIRVVCQNTLSAALSANYMKMRIPVAEDAMAASLLSHKIQETAENAKNNLIGRANKLVGQKVTREQVDDLLDELFPYILTPESGTIDSSHEKANEKTTLMRETFIHECLGADNLANYRGTAYQIYNGATDYFQHYWTNMENAYDLNKRMQNLPGYGISEGVGKINKTLKFLNKIAA